MKRRLIFVAASAASAACAASVAIAAAARRTLRSRRDKQGYFAPIVSINRTAADIEKEPGLMGIVGQDSVQISEERGNAIVRARTEDGPSWRKLREARQLLETGEVLRVEGQPHGTRKPLGTVLVRVGQAFKERTR